MFYLALLLVLVGLLIFLVALFSEKSNIDTSNKYAKSELFSNKYKKSPEFKEEDIIFPEISDDFTETQLRDHEEDVFVSLSSDLPSEMPYEEDLNFDDKTRATTIQEEELIPDSGPLRHEFIESEAFADERDDRIYAVLYDDKTGSIDYKKLKNIVAPSEALYKNMKRLGKGELRLDEDGLSFHMDSRLYRFDFYKIADLFVGDDYLALPLKESNSVKLFLIEGNNTFATQVLENFREYLKVE